MFQPPPYMVKRLKRRIFEVSGDRDLVDARWDGDYGAICIFVRSLGSGKWRVHDTLLTESGNPRPMVEHDIDRMSWRYNSANTVEKDDPFRRAELAREKQLAGYERDKDNLALGLMRGNL